MHTATKRPLNILHLLISLEIGGMERFVCDHCLGIDTTMFHPMVVCTDALGDFATLLEERGIPVTLLPKNKDRFDWKYILTLRSFLRSHDIDILHVHSGSFPYGAFAGFLARTPVIILTDHGRIYTRTLKILIFDILCSIIADKIISVSSDLTNFLTEKEFISHNKVTTIINGVNTKNFYPKPKAITITKQLNSTNENVVIGTIGRFAEVKGQEYLIRAFQRLKEQCPQAKLVLVGDGPDKEKLMQLAQSLSLIDDIVFMGKRNDISDLLSIMDVFVLPSLMEGTSIALLEAMASGIACVATNVGGNPGVITDGVDGLLANVGDPIDLAEKIVLLVNNETMRHQIGTQAVEKINNKYSLDANIKQYQAVYLQLWNA